MFSESVVGKIEEHFRSNIAFSKIVNLLAYYK